MSCSCKVTKHINKIEKRYGTSVLKTKKTDIKSIINTWFKKILIIVLIIPFTPLTLLYLLYNNIFSKNIISIDKLFKIKNKNVGTK